MMRRSSKPEAKSENEPFTYVHQGTKIKGDLEAKGRVRIHGIVLGNIIVDGVLEIAETGFVEGDFIRAAEVKIIGRVQANVEAKGKIEIWKNGNLTGDVRAKALDIEEGAAFTGRSEMNSSPKPVAKLLEAPADQRANQPKVSIKESETT